MAVEEEMFDSSLLLHPQYFWLHVQFFLARLSLVKIMPLCRYQRKILIFRGIFNVRMNLCLKGGCLSIRCKYQNQTVYNPDLIKFHLKVYVLSTRLTWAIWATRSCHSTSLLSTTALLKEIFRGCVAITLATIAWGSRTILYRDGYLTLNGKVPTQISSQKRALLPSLISKEPQYYTGMDI